ncbi:MAG: amidohydrolase [Anaerolineae bacterium]
MDSLQMEALSAIDEERGALVRLADDLYAHPETGYQEHHAAAQLTGFLRDHGFQVQHPYGGVDTAFRAQVGADRPTVALIAEYDALPSIGHGCGHNLIAAGTIGAALAAAAVISQLEGSVAVIGTPAEEVLYQTPGKVRLLQAGAFHDIDAAISFHPWTGTGLLAKDRALVSLHIAFHGRPAHAAADPWNGINALDGVLLTFNAINALRQHIKPEARIHGNITHGGEVPNVIHAYAAAQIIVRAEDRRYLFEELLPKVENCAHGASIATGAQLEIVRNSEIDTTLNNPVLAGVLEQAAKECGVSFGAPIDLGASTDFANLSRTVPAACFMVDIGLPPGTAWHSREVAEASHSPAGHRAMLDAARIMALAVLELLRRPELVQQALAAHRAATD